MEKSFLSECKQSSSITFFALFNFFLIGFCRWVSSARIFLSTFFPLLQHYQRVEESLIKQIQEWEEEEVDGLCREDAEIVMRGLGLLPDSERNELQERYSSKKVSSLFEEKEASLEEVKQAFDVFDKNRDGFIDATEFVTNICVECFIPLSPLLEFYNSWSESEFVRNICVECFILL
ncbi:hypothetical protein Bca52824_019493 [Brassica carinata]|uniref:EF-hand domain-containing protein n=1 Tax=Brassica carinata TaxID=52824 RepID=A0A8X7VRX1_BRACI|nr:hypothetical protein Bca52824_019493 [Brassica carinata]